MNGPLVSIITCTYNRVRMLMETVSSILAQQYAPVENLVVDDGSTDDAQKAIAALGDKIRYHHQEHKGFAAALNFACQKMARGEYIAINDDDDLMLPGRISSLYGALSRFPQAVLAIGDAEMIDADGNRTGKRINPDIEIERDGPILIEDGYKAIMWPLIRPATCATLFRKTDGERIGWFDEGFSRGGDTDFFGRLAQLGPIVYLPRVVACYRRGHPSKWSNNIANNLLCEYSNLMLFKKHLESVCGERREMAERLQTRMLHALKMIAFLACQAENAAGVSKGELMNIKNGLSLLDMKKRLAYEWYIRIRLPLRNAIRGQ
ncbi:MAG: glycosyltransferase [Nitrospiraceae bacterium]|nr:glycosyltransferase [Nitrospiraceae bacterium]